jgi:osmotically-inducible protein OsmY
MDHPMSLQALLHLPALRRDTSERAVVRPAAPATADEGIRQALLRRLQAAPWWDGRTANVFVDDGVVIYQGLRGTGSERVAAQRLALALPGVRGVWDARVPRREWQAMA